MPSVDYVKQWLSRYSENEAQLGTTIERLEALRSRLKSPGSPTLSGMPHGGGYEGDQIGRMLGQIERLEEIAQEQLEKSRLLYAEINNTIDQITGRKWPGLRVVLKMRYLDGFSWEEINKILWGKKPDFDDRTESYMRRAFRLYSEALAAIIPVLQGTTESEERQ